MLNQTIIIGRTTKEPEFRQTQNGVSVATFTIACDRNYKNAQGEKETDFFTVVCWRGLAETIGKYLGKGRLVAVSGRLQNRSYEAKDGTKRYITEIIFFIRLQDLFALDIVSLDAVNDEGVG